MGGGRTCLGFNTLSIKSLAFVSTSALIEAVTEALFFAGRIFHGSLGFAIVISDHIAQGKKPFKKLARVPSLTASARNSVPCWLPQL